MLKPIAFFLFIFLLFPAIKSFSLNSYHIAGEIKGASGHKFYLFNIYGGLKNSNNIRPIDSLIAKADTFSFWGTFDETQYYSLSMDSSEWFVSIVIDTGRIVVTGIADSFPRFRIRESWENETLRSFGMNTNALVYKMNAAANNKDMAQYDSVLNMFLDSILAYTKRYPNSYGVFSTATSLLPDEIRFKVFGKKWFPLISDKLKNTSKGKQIAYILYSYNIDSFIGKPFPPIKTFTTTKKAITFSLNPQYIYLIDYWASWCIPCIEKLPQLKKIYATHKKDGFKIVSLSIDKNYGAWINAVKKYDIMWDNYSSLNGTDADDTKYFNIQSIPYTILVGKGNKIIKINPTEEEVELYLKKQ